MLNKIKNSLKRNLKLKSKLKTKRNPAHTGIAASANEYKWKRSPKAIFRQNDDQSISVIRVDDANAYYKLDAWAKETWNLIDGKNSTSTLIAKISSKSKLDSHFVSKEVKNLIKQLEKFQLIQ